MANAIPVNSSKGAVPSEPKPATKVDWKVGLPDAVVAAVEALGGPEDPRSQSLLDINDKASNPVPTQGKVLRRIELESHKAVRIDH